MITIDKGVYTSVKINISEEVDFSAISKIVFTLKNNVEDKPIVVFDITSTGEHILEITPEQSQQIRKYAVYDFDLITIDNKRYKITENEQVVIRKGVGNAYD